MGLIRYHAAISRGTHEPIPTNIGLWMFFIMLHRHMVSKTLKCKKKKKKKKEEVFGDVIASVLYGNKKENTNIDIAM